ncbi:unnamed protein product [Rhizophagus irregularis]|nr:unnamed protein product [Rhizophagus irregularis]
MRDNLQWYSDPGSTCDKQDIKHVEVCGSSANFPQKTFPAKITQNKESKMSDKAEVPDKSKTSDKLLAGVIVLNCLIPGENVKETVV